MDNLILPRQFVILRSRVTKNLGFHDPETQLLRSLWSLRMTYWTGVGVALILQ
jgi:hypothetical protein